jgi:hypothetical protein
MQVDFAKLTYGCSSIVVTPRRTLSPRKWERGQFVRNVQASCLRSS